jgi:hypothetical protein
MEILTRDLQARVAAFLPDKSKIALGTTCRSLHSVIFGSSDCPLHKGKANYVYGGGGKYQELFYGLEKRMKRAIDRRSGSGYVRDRLCFFRSAKKAYARGSLAEAMRLWIRVEAFGPFHCHALFALRWGLKGQHCKQERQRFRQEAAGEDYTVLSGQACEELLMDAIVCCIDKELTIYQRTR